MPRIRVGAIRYASVAAAIGRELGIEPAPDCRIGPLRITMTFRNLGASRWPEAQQIEHALRVVAVARAVMSADSRRAVRERVTRAIVVVYEDVTLVRGCAVTARWECVVPGAQSRAGLVSRSS